jgi:hypothetical protein
MVNIPIVSTLAGDSPRVIVASSHDLNCIHGGFLAPCCVSAHIAFARSLKQ